MEKGKYYLGLDIGTDSVGYAVTDEQYNLRRFHGSDAWGTHIFDEAKLSAETRGFRTSRRRLDRRQQRVELLRELFAKEISKKDEKFFIRLQESYLYREECDEKFILFNDTDYTDKDYFKKYPTIHHLISELMRSEKEHDVRLVYLACAWLVAHRGHFLSTINTSSMSSIREFESLYSSFMSFFSDNGYRLPWEGIDIIELKRVLRLKEGVSSKNRLMVDLLCNGVKPSKLSCDENADEEFPFSLEGIIKLLAGGTYALKDLFGKSEYENLEQKTVSLGMDEEKMSAIMADIGDDYNLIDALRTIYDWALLENILDGDASVSDAKVKIYEQHKADLELLKRIIRTYVPDKYDDIFRNIEKDNYVAYSGHFDKGNVKKSDKEGFSKYLLLQIKSIVPNENEREEFERMKSRIEMRSFLPKQKDTDNRVIPCQLYFYELQCILNNAEKYLPFFSQRDEEGISIKDKVESVFRFKVPYYVGPLNSNSKRAWIIRKPGKIYPWNFDKMVDLDASEEQFIKKMTNTCSYLPGEPVLPKDSLLYHKFMVLNEINNIRISGDRISVELKQRIYNEVFLQKKKVTKKYLISWLVMNGYLEKGCEHFLSGIDEEIHSNLVPQIAFRRLIESGAISERDAERIIERASYAEDKTRLSSWLKRNYGFINEEDRRYICSIKIKDFGRLSRQFLEGLEGTDYVTGELVTVINALWNTNNNLMEIVADAEKYSFCNDLAELSREYYEEHHYTLEDRMDEMYLSSSVKRAVYRTLDVVKDVKKAFGTPTKVFVEMARGGEKELKGKRTKSRKQQLLDLFTSCKDEDVRLLRKQLEEMGDAADTKLQSEKLFLYYVQLGRCMYTEKAIDINRLGDNKLYDVDHIYPQAYVKDDSIINNKVLCLSEENGRKRDVYPISDEIRHRMIGFWSRLKKVGLISDEKFKRLTRSTPFTDEEKYDFINRQIVETTQSTKAVATLLKDYFPETEIVYSKARMTSEFRQEFDLPKSRIYNDLHHAVDAYLNIVTGNVYNSKFTKNFRVDRPYSIKTKTVFSHPVILQGNTIWDGGKMLEKVKSTAMKNSAHFTKFSFMKKGGLFDQNMVPAGPGYVPIKKGRDTEKYGGYNKAGIMFFIPVRYRIGKKSEVLIMSVEILHGEKFLQDSDFAREYSFARLKQILNKTVDDVEFPMGMRPWKVNTVLSLDGFRVCIAGMGSGGKCLVAQPIMQFNASKEWVTYIKRLERYCEKVSKNPNYVFDEHYDVITTEKNVELYDLYIKKYESSVFSKRVNPPLSIIKAGRDRFLALDINSQAKALLCVHQTFGRVSGGCDLTLVGGAGKAAATVNFSSTISNWKKLYSEVRVIDESVSGLWMKASDNIFDLL